MYLKDLNHKMTLRLNDDLSEFVKEQSDNLAITPSDFIRQCIAAYKKAMEMTNLMTKGILERELERAKMEVFANGTDHKTDFNDKL